LKPFFFEANEIERSSAGEQSIKLVLIDEIAKPPLRRRALINFSNSRLGKSRSFSGAMLPI
jgi:hypothetical protein